MPQQNTNELMLRRDKHKAMRKSQSLPSSTVDRIIVPCLERTYGFKTNSYWVNREILEDFISQDCFENFVHSANRLINTEMMQKVKLETLPFFCWTFFFLKISIAVGFLPFAILGTLVYFDIESSLQNILLYVCVGCIIFSVVIASLSPIHLYSKKFPDYNFHKNIKEQLKRLVDEENSRNKSKNMDHLRWKIDKQFYWIQLEINHALYRSKNPSTLFFQPQEES